ncbi:hypothetical protein TNCV_4458311 [Trichonephila clavipes]|nr:hypothetical protein TNCV_4458311 [Trichonephila clavipes]
MAPKIGAPDSEAGDENFGEEGGGRRWRGRKWRRGRPSNDPSFVREQHGMSQKHLISDHFQHKVHIEFLSVITEWFRELIIWKSHRESGEQDLSTWLHTSRRPSWRSRSRTCRAVFGSDRPLRAPFRPSLGAGPGPRRCRLAPGEPARRRRRSGGARFVPGPRTPPRAPRPRPGEGTGGRSRRAAERRRQSNSSRAAAARSEQRDTRCDDSHAQIS